MLRWLVMRCVLRTPLRPVRCSTPLHVSSTYFNYRGITWRYIQYLIQCVSVEDTREQIEIFSMEYTRSHSNITKDEIAVNMLILPSTDRSIEDADLVLPPQLTIQSFVQFLDRCFDRRYSTHLLHSDNVRQLTPNALFSPA